MPSSESVVAPSQPRWLAHLSNAAYGLAMRRLFHARLSPAELRRNLERFAATSRMRLQQKFPQTRIASLQIGNVCAESISAVANPGRVILYLHGGGYVFGSIDSYRRRALKLSYRCAAEVIIPDYRLAPEHPFPAAFFDARDAWTHANDRAGNRPCLVAGDSAGGGLALALAASLRERCDAPDAVIALSPWTDLTLEGESMLTNRRRDCWLRRDQLRDWAQMYCGDAPADHALISPLFARMEGMPPLLLLAGDQEVLLDDTRRLAARARRAGVRVEEVIGRGMQHDWPLTLPWLAESKRAWNAIAEFVNAIAPGRTVGVDRAA